MAILLNTCRTVAPVLALGAWLVCAPLFAQDLSGSWRGELVHNMNTRFVVEMELTVLAGRITGTGHKAFAFQPEIGASLSIEGEQHGRRFQLQETAVSAERDVGYRWAMQGGLLALDTNGGQWRLYGEWRSPGCEPGQLVLFMDKRAEPVVREDPPLPVVLPQNVEGRKVHWAGTVKVREESVVLWLYDDLRYDGDTVSVFVNGQCVARRLEVPHRRTPRALTVHLLPGTNHLVMHAENEGSEAPNTAGLVVRTRGRKHRLVLRSTMNHSGGLVIEREP